MVVDTNMYRRKLFSEYDIPMRTKQNLEDLKFMIRTEFESHRYDTSKVNPMGVLGWFEIHANQSESNPFMVKLLGFDDHNRWRMLRLHAEEDASELILFPSEFVVTQCALLNSEGGTTHAWRLLEHAVISGCDACSEKKLLHVHHKLRLCGECITTHNPRMEKDILPFEDDTLSEDSDYVLPSHHTKTLVAGSSSTHMRDHIPLTRAIRKSLIPSTLSTIRGNCLDGYSVIFIYACSLYLYVLCS